MQKTKLPKLSDMQIEAGTLFKYKADKVLKIIQGLYEKGIVSYPRTDSNYLSANDRSVVIKSLNRLGRAELTCTYPQEYSTIRIQQKPAIMPLSL